MERPAGEHLQPQEIAELCYDAVRKASRPSASEVHPHLAVCPACRESFEQCADLDRQLKNLPSPEPASPHSDCPEPTIWFDVAGGVMGIDLALVQIQHASGCDHCGPLLQQAVADLNGEVTGAELELLASLRSASPEWRRQLAQRVTGTVVPEPAATASWWTRWATVPRLVTAGAGLLAVAIAATWVAANYWNQPTTAQRLLAQAFTEQRTLELRIAGAAYAPPKVQLGPSGSFMTRPEQLLKAETLIAQKLGSHPSDPSWLQAKAQADLLEGRYDPAIESLRRALQLDPKSPGIMIDLATAYFQRGQAAGQPEDYGAAYEQLSRALALRPDDPVALFNRAIVSEQQFLYRQALDDWEHYLRVDSRSEWAAEARQRAEKVRAKLKARESRAEPLSPSQIVARASDPRLTSEVDERIEEYLALAVSSWLPRAYPETGSSTDPAAARALFFLADLTARQHRDPWLSDLLRGASSPNFTTAVAALSRAAQANSAAQFDKATEEADLADRRFRDSGNAAGALRAQFERVFAAQLRRQSEDCRQRAMSASAESERFPYVWLHIQLGLESAVCSGLMGDLDTDLRLSQRGIERAQQSGYQNLYLRALGFVAGDKLELGDRRNGWKLTNACLDRFWSGTLSAMRGYNCYTILAAGADSVNWPNLQLASLRESVSLIDTDPDLLLRALAHSSAANAAADAHQPRIAELHYAQAAHLYALVPQGQAARNDRIEAEIRTAQLEARQNKLDSALERLTRVQSETRQLSNDYLLQIFYSILGEVQLRRNRPAEAEQALRAAVVLAERNLCALNSELERITWSKNAAPIYLGLAEATLVQGREQDSLEIFEWYLGASQRAGADCPGTAASRAPAPQPFSNPSRLPSRLPRLSAETVLAYGPLPDGLAIWIYDNRGVSAHWIPKTEHDPEELAARFYGLASDPKSELNALRRDGQELYKLLIAPMEQRLDLQRTLVIEAQGWLAKLPFEVLLDSNGHYLVEHGPIVHSLGLYSDEQLRDGDTISPDMAALIIGSTAASQEDGQMPPPGVVAESEAVAGNFHNPRVLMGPNATLSAVKRELPGAAVFNFAGHSLVTPDKAGLVMEDKEPRTGRPRLLDADSLRRLNLPNLQLAVLSACSTGVASPEDSSEFSSIADALLRSGVPHVVASRWPVDSVETRQVVEAFYRTLLSGMPVAQAIRTTSQNMLGNPRTAHPYYWSAFAAYGQQ